MNAAGILDDIICAPASGSGGAIGIVRVSGNGCLQLIDRVVQFRSGAASDSPGFRLKFGVVPDLDEVLVGIFRTPHSYTGEDMAEISCHASSYIVEELLGRLCAAGCRMAGPGEFTRRAYTAGKMDLSQAEAVADLIAADSMASHKLAFSQLRGAYSKKLRSLREQMVELAALLELELDFSEEDVEFADRRKLDSLARETLSECERLADSFRLGNAFKKGIPVAIAGPVNSGKSTLLNALLGEERALVSDIPGTTRDTVEEILVLNGVAYRFIDTAGLRDTTDVVERMGIERAVSQIDKAAVIVVLLDSSAPEDELRKVVSSVNSHIKDDSRVIWVRSKADLLGSVAAPFTKTVHSVDGSGQNRLPVHENRAFCERLGIPEAIDLSARSGQGLDELKAAICKDDAQRLAASEGVLVSNQRHQAALLAAAEALHRFLDGIASGVPSELLAEDLRAATSSLGEIFGAITHQDISSLIFSRFCIGK